NDQVKFNIEEHGMIDITTDSCNDLSQELLDRFKIRAIPLQVIINDKAYKDGVDISIDKLFQYVDQTKQLPKTSAPSIQEFIDFFSAETEDSIFISISSQLSATNANAKLSSQSVQNKKVHIIDSLNLSTGIGLLVCKAAELRDKGLSADEILKEVEATIPRVRTSFVIDTLEYLYMGGRCSAMQNVVGSILRIRPIIQVRPDGTLGIKEKITGARKKALDAILSDFAKHKDKADLQRVFVTHTGCADDAEYLRNSLLNIAPIQYVYITTAGATIASHCGPNTIGILYLEKA
ncbi:MAG TPA: DegV family protein, partial [Longilinea sp.]|nr:DegV family protein [Longilinea sp.]